MPLLRPLTRRGLGSTLERQNSTYWPCTTKTDLVQEVVVTRHRQGCPRDHEALPLRLRAPCWGTLFATGCPSWTFRMTETLCLSSWVWFVQGKIPRLSHCSHKQASYCALSALDNPIASGEAAPDGLGRQSLPTLSCSATTPPEQTACPSPSSRPQIASSGEW